MLYNPSLRPSAGDLVQRKQPVAQCSEGSEDDLRLKKELNPTHPISLCDSQVILLHQGSQIGHEILVNDCPIITASIIVGC